VSVIRIGHFAQFQKMFNIRVGRVRDKFGRTLMYMTVLHERRHMFRNLLKLCPSTAKINDKVWPIPLLPPPTQKNVTVRTIMTSSISS